MVFGLDIITINAQIFFKFLLVFIMSFVFGVERQKAHKPVGFGTYVFVALGSCAFTVVAVEMGLEKYAGFVTAVITSIGFLGAGALIKTGDKVFGFTSAATIWVFSVIGAMVGMKQYFIAIFLYIMMWIVTLYDKYTERHGTGIYQKKVIITTNKIIDTEEIEASLGTKKHKLLEQDINKKENKAAFTYMVDGTKEQIDEIPKRLMKKDWFESFKGE